MFKLWSENDLERGELNARFRDYSHEDLTASNGYFVLAPPTKESSSAAA